MVAPDPFPAPAEPGKGPRPRILLIRPTALGDVCRTVPALVTLRRAMPTAHIDWLVNDAFGDAIRHHPDLNGIVGFARTRFARWFVRPRVAFELVSWLRNLYSSHYDLVVDLQGLLRSGIFTWITRAPHRLGYSQAREFGWLGYNHRHDIRAPHAVDRMLALLAADGFAPVCDMRLYLGPQDRNWLTRFLDDHALTDEPYFALAPTARWLCKCWPLENYAAIVKRLMASGSAGKKVVLVASPNERAQVQPLLDALGGNTPVIFPQTSVGQMMALVSRARLLICNDSAPMHVAVGFDRPFVSIFGPTDPVLEGPYQRQEAVVEPPGMAGVRRDGHRWQRDDQTLIARVGVEEVWAKVVEQLAR